MSFTIQLLETADPVVCRVTLKECFADLFNMPKQQIMQFVGRNRERLKALVLRYLQHPPAWFPKIPTAAPMVRWVVGLSRGAKGATPEQAAERLIDAVAEAPSSLDEEVVSASMILVVVAAVLASVIYDEWNYEDVTKQDGMNDFWPKGKSPPNGPPPLPPPHQTPPPLPNEE